MGVALMGRNYGFDQLEMNRADVRWGQLQIPNHKSGCGKQSTPPLTSAMQEP